MSLAHWDNVLSHARVLFNYVGANSSSFATAKYCAVYTLGIRNAVCIFPHVQPGGVASTIGCSTNIAYIHSRFLLFLICACSIAYEAEAGQVSL